MFRLFISTVLLGASVPSMAAFPALNYESVVCRLTHQGVGVRELSYKLMTLMIEERFGRFVQIQFGDDNRLIQYQLLIEDDVRFKAPGHLIFLQNLKVDDVEVSSEFSSKEANWVRLLNGDYAVECDLKQKTALEDVPTPLH